MTPVSGVNAGAVQPLTTAGKVLGASMVQKPGEEPQDRQPKPVMDEYVPEGPQEPPEGHIQAITMICPICGQHLRGNTEKGKAYCNYCKRSFPLPQILK